MKISRDQDRITVFGALAGETISVTLAAPNGEILNLALSFDADLNVIDSAAQVVGRMA